MSQLAEERPPAVVRPSRGPYATTPGTTMVWSADDELIALCESALLSPERNRANARHFAQLSTLPGLLSRIDACLRGMGVPARRASNRWIEELAYEIRQVVAELEVQP